MSPPALLSFCQSSPNSVSGSEVFQGRLPCIGLRLVKLCSGLFQTGKSVSLLDIQKSPLSNVTLAPMCYKNSLIKHFFELILSVPSPRMCICIQRIELAVILSSNCYMVPRFLASLLHLGLMLDLSDCTPPFPEQNSSAPFAPSVPQT